ncbi:hypothetical protein [Pusillimonas sp.]|uniref:hypothetical protein n=1 Tax=Pusillimonas sp. TaxID=3040095 RepID=UPI0037CC9B18
MGSVVKKVGSVVGKVFGIDPGGEADAIRDAAEKQAEATRKAAEEQAKAAQEAAAQQVNLVRQQSAAAAAAQAANINQATVAAQLAEEAKSRPVEDTSPDITAPDAQDTEQARRRYRSGSSSPLGGSSSGVGIKL